jgi:hypothetical protein
MSYCSDTLKEIFLELPLPAGGMIAVFIETSAGARVDWYALDCCAVLVGAVDYEMDRVLVRNSVRSARQLGVY